jgi:hypothetical protein
VTRRQLRRSALSLLMAASLAACGGTAADTADGGPGPAAGSTTSAADAAPSSDDAARTPSTAGRSTTAAANAPALTFAGVDLDGEPVAGESFAGGDVVLWMWAPW